MNEHSSEKMVLPPFKVINRGLQWFIAISIGVMFPLFLWKSPTRFGLIWEHLNAFSLILLLPLAALDFWVGGLRIWIFFNGKVMNRIPLWHCMRANWANLFMGAVTPFYTGGGPAQLFVLWRQGAKISQGALVSLLNFAASLIFFSVASVLSLILLPADLFGSGMTPIINTAIGVIFGVTAIVLCLIASPKMGLSFLHWLFRFIPRRWIRFRNNSQALLNKFNKGISSFTGAFEHIWRDQRSILVILFLITMVLYLVKFLMGYFIVISLQQDVHFSTFMGVQVIQLFLLNFAPTPGGAGIAEASSFWLMEKIIAADFILVYTLLWRFFTTLLGAMMGGGVLLFEARGWLQKSK